MLPTNNQYHKIPYIVGSWLRWSLRSISAKNVSLKHTPYFYFQNRKNLKLKQTLRSSTQVNPKMTLKKLNIIKMSRCRISGKTSVESSPFESRLIVFAGHFFNSEVKIGSWFEIFIRSVAASWHRFRHRIHQTTLVSLLQRQSSVGGLFIVIKSTVQISDLPAEQWEKIFCPQRMCFRF